MQKGVRQGLRWAQGPNRRHSRLWTALHFDLDEGEQSDLVHWMPAHTSQAQVGEVKCSDGTRLTDTMRCANAMVDRLAKQAAESIAISPAMRARSKERFKQARELAIFVGQVTYAAGHCDQGDGHLCLCRDSVGLSAAAGRRRPAPRAKRACRATAEVGTVPTSLEERSDVVARVLQRIRSKWQVAP